MTRRQWFMGHSSCIEKIEALKALDVEFDEYRVGRIKKEIIWGEKILKERNMWDVNGEEILKYKDLENYHAKLLRKEETLWRKDGDRNTKFFHSKANQRKKTGEIKKIKDENRMWWRGKERVERAFIDFFFFELFATSLLTLCYLMT